MSFGAFTSGTASSPVGVGSVQAGADLQEIQSTELEFSGFNGETKIQLLPSAWPDSELPPPTSSLLSVTSKSGLLAAGGPDSIIVAKLNAVREAFEQRGGDGNIKPFQPQLVIPLGIRVSQVAFSADGSCLAISAEQGGGVAAYDVKNLLQGNTKSTFELASDGQSLRCLAPNPASEFAELFAAVTVKGQLLIADMKLQSWRQGQNGNVLQEGASAVAWSTRGKALLVGLGDGSVVQLKSDGSLMSRVPRPPNLDGDKHVSSISWLENDLALFVYTPSSTDGMADPSDFYIWERSPKSNPPAHKFSKLPEIASGWGSRTPAFQFMSRLKDFHNCNQIIVVSTTPSEDVGIVCRSTVPLAEGAPVNVFTSTTQANDSRRAILPMKADMSASTTPIGMDLDLASTKSIPRPIPGDEYDESPGPLPGLMILNTDGVLAAWWLVYADAIRKGVSYPDLTVNISKATPTPTQSLQTQSNTSTSSPFGSANAAPQRTPAFGQTSMGSNGPVFGQSSKPAFGSTSFGSASLGQNRPTFGSPSAIGDSTPVFGSASSMGSNKPNQPSGVSFGSASSLGAQGSKTTVPSSAPATIFGSGNKLSTFGAPSTGTASPFASAGGTNTTAKVFGSTEPGQPNTSPFGKAPQAPAGVFGAPSSTSSPFATAAGQGRSVPGSASGNVFGTGSKSSFGSTSTSQDKSTSNPFTKTSPFTLTSSFADSAFKDSKDEATNSKAPGPSPFGAAFGGALDDAKNVTPSANREDVMEDEAPPAKGPESPEITQSTTPKETPAGQKSIGSGSETTGAWGASTLLKSTPPTETSKHSGVPTFSLTQDTPRPATVQEMPKAAEKSPGETPLPPDATSKDTYTPTNSSTSSIDTFQGSAENAPLPPDFLKPKSKEKAASEDVPPLPPDFSKNTTIKKTPPTSAPQENNKKPAYDQEAAALPPDFLSKVKAPSKSAEQPPTLPAEESSQFDDEGSGVDVAKELSVEASPESSFGSKSSSSNVFVSKPAPATKLQSTQSVFADVVKPHVPFFEMPPPGKEPESPRSPSPVRSGRGMPDLKPPSMAVRSVSGPAVSKGAQGARKATMGRMQPPPQKFVQPIASFTLGEDSTEQRRAAEKKRQEQQAAEEEALSDQDDEYIRAELEAPMQPTTKMPAFLAHTDYTGGVAKTGVPGQIEVVFRDANSMIDTLGLNARALSSWVAGHSIAGKKADGSSKRHVEDLEDPEGWTMIDVNELVGVESTIQHELSDGAIGSRQSQVLTRLVHDMTSEVNKLRRRNEEISRTVDILKKSTESSHESDEEERVDLAPLSAVAAEAQHDLRRSLTDFRSNLTAAEEGVALLRTKLSNVDIERSQTGSYGNVPTVEAVERTIAKMTAMFERKSADLDVLTAQAKQLGISDETMHGGSKSSQLASGLNGRRSRSGGPFESSMTSRPGSSARSPYGTPLRAGLGQGKLRSSFTLAEQTEDLSATAQERKLLGMEASSRYVERLKVRRAVKTIMKETLGDGRPRVRALDAD